MNASRSVCLLIFLTVSLAAAAQKGHISFEHLGKDAGLSNNQVNCIFRDQKGFMWFGTFSGLDRYDGSDFKIFRNDPGNPSTIGENSISSIFELPEGKMGVNTTNRGLNIYDPATERFDRNAAAYFSHWNMPDGEISLVLKDTWGCYWFLYKQYGLYKYSPANHASEKVPAASRWKTDTTDATPNAGHSIATFCPDSKGDVWVVYSNGTIEKLNGQKYNVLFHSETVKKANNGENLLYSVFVDKQDELWITTHNFANGVFYYKPFNDSLIHFYENDPRHRLNSNIVVGGEQGITQDNNGTIWIGADHGGINLVNKKDLSVQYLMNDPDDNKSLRENAIYSVYKDNTGIVWVGTHKHGVSYYDDENSKFALFRHRAADPGSLPYEDVNCFAEDAQGNLWIGSNGGGLIYFDRSRNVFTQYRHSAADPQSLSSDVVVSLCIDHEQHLWIGTYFGCLDRFDKGKFQHFRHDPANPASISDDNVWHIMEDSHQNLWIGTLSHGLDRMDRKKNVFYHYRNGDSTLPSGKIPSLYVASILEDRNGNIWAGTSYGIEMLNIRTGRFTYYFHDDKDPQSISSDGATNMIQDSRGLIWIATIDGLNLFDPKKNIFRVFRKADGLPDNAIISIVEDNDHNLWLSLPDGLSNVTVVTNSDGTYGFRFSNYSKADGLQEGEFNAYPGLKTAKGELVFGGAEGFNLFQPDKIRNGRTVPNVVLTDLQVFNQSVTPGVAINNHVILERDISETRSITLNYDEDVFSIQFAALDFAHSERDQYEYMMQGFDKEWLRSGSNQRRVTYTNLDPGDYVFKVKAMDNDGAWTSTILSLPVTIRPPFWMTWWFRTLMWAALVGLAFVAYRIRTKSLHVAKDLAEKTAFVKSKFLSNMSHELRTPLNGIIGTINLMLQDRYLEEQKEHLNVLKYSSELMLGLINDVLDFSKIEAGKLQLDMTCFNLKVLLEKTRTLFQQQFIAKGVGLKLDVDEHLDVFVMSDEIRINQILHNLLSNALKFTERGKVILSAKVNTASSEEISVTFSVLDSGIGISEDKLSDIFDSFSQADINTTRKYGGTGLGLAISKKLVQIFGSELEVESKVGSGSRFFFTVGLRLVTGRRPYVNEQGTKDLSSLAGMRVLVAEDNNISMKVTKRFLQKWGVEAAEAKNGHEVLNQFRKGAFDLLLLDLEMPEMDGYAAIKEIRKTDSEVPAIAFTASIFENMKEELQKHGFQDFIRKPFRPADLHKKLLQFAGAALRER
ncbi:MAG: two-component regulator propeller domain-containing protein [Bacteroidota bacterium]|nr:two-component regulator propeller domain-containing protein [Bacteroidota bacterium]MDP4252423.1 two-component regulator propeller domain-containing protein [Bacteroidota bacterium]MDP4258601.1 two-component regulator propeller domain-containing protein [Bacteroidota bacterium]